MVKDWEKALVHSNYSIVETIRVIDESRLQMAIVVNDSRKLLGVVTDGDVRRGILNNITLDSPITEIMNPNPVVASKNESSYKIVKLMRKNSLKHIPIVDKQRQIVGLQTIQDIYLHDIKENPVILMAGGMGMRLRPLTESTPKPLLKVGEKPILETILESFIEYNFHNFFISVNYKSKMIKDHFEDGSRWDVSVQYIDEEKQLGTAGALSLLDINFEKPLIIMNGDILTKVNFEQLLAFHEEHSSLATMCVREYIHQVPYGVVQTEGHKLITIEEKPTHRYFVNAGIYVLSPKVLKYIPKNEYYDMPTLFEMVVKQGKETCIFPIREYWLDIGRMSDYERANIEFSEVFI